jgi:hypothetical protein
VLHHIQAALVCAEHPFFILEPRLNGAVDLYSNGKRLEGVCGGLTACPEMQSDETGKPGLQFNGLDTLATVHMPSGSQTMPLGIWRGTTIVLQASFTSVDASEQSVMFASENDAIELRQEGENLRAIFRESGTIVVDITWGRATASTTHNWALVVAFSYAPFLQWLVPPLVERV